MTQRRRTAAERRKDRARGVDRYGRPLPRTLGTNPRAQRRAAQQAGGTARTQDRTPDERQPAADLAADLPAPSSSCAPAAATTGRAQGPSGPAPTYETSPHHGRTGQGAQPRPPQGVDRDELVGQGEDTASSGAPADS